MIRDAGFALALRVIGTAMWLIYTIVLARFLSQEEFGLVLFALNFILIATPVATLGFETATMRFGSQYWHMANTSAFHALVKQGRIFAALGGFLCALALLIAALSGLNTPLTKNPFISGVIGLSIIAAALMSIHRDALRSAGRLVVGLLGFSVTRAILPLIGSITLGITGHLAATSALALYLASLGASLIFELWQISRLKGHSTTQTSHDVQRPRKHFNVALSAWPGDIAGALLARATGLVVGLTLNLEVAALYLAAERIAALAQFFTEAVRVAAGPEVARAAQQKHTDPKKFQHTVTRVSCLMFIVDTIGKLGVIVIGWLLLWLLGSIYTTSYPTLLLLLLGTYSWGILGPSALVMNMSGLQKMRSVATAVASLMIILLSWVGVTLYGQIGAAIGFAFTTWLLNGFLVWTIYQKQHIKCGIFGVPARNLKTLLSQAEIDTLKSYWRRMHHA